MIASLAVRIPTFFISILKALFWAFGYFTGDTVLNSSLERTDGLSIVGGEKYRENDRVIITIVIAKIASNSEILVPVYALLYTRDR